MLARESTRSDLDCARSVRSASAAVAPSVESVAGLRKSATTIVSSAPNVPRPCRDPKGPMPIARITMKVSTSAAKLPTAIPPPSQARRQETCGLAFIANVAKVPCSAVLPPGVNCGVAVKVRCTTRWTYQVVRITGSPASITPSEPGKTQSGSPITSVAAHAVSATSAVAVAQRAIAFPKRMRPPARMDGAAAPVPLDVMLSSTRTRSPACSGRWSGCFNRQRITSSASGSGQSVRSVRMSFGVSTSCAASICVGESPWKGGRPASISNAITPNA